MKKTGCVETPGNRDPREPAEPWWEIALGWLLFSAALAAALTVF